MHLRVVHSCKPSYSKVQKAPEQRLPQYLIQNAVFTFLDTARKVHIPIVNASAIFSIKTARTNKLYNVPWQLVLFNLQVLM